MKECGRFNKKVSVVVPVYNVEKYLDRCLRSIVGQTYGNLEIILVDDESPDRCPQMCEQWAEIDRRIKVIHKKNAGLGMARNTGIEHATGDYICFFDSDDYVDLTTIEKALTRLLTEQADIAVFGMNRVDINNNIVQKNVPKSEYVCFRGENVISHFLPCLMQKHTNAAKVTNISFSACLCMFSMDLVKKCEWRFASEREIIAEDLYSLLELYSHVQCVTIIPEALYYYCENGTSLTQTYRDDRFVRNKVFYQKLIELCKTCAYPPEIERCCMSPFLGNTIATMKQIVGADCCAHNTKKLLTDIIDDPMLQIVLKEKMNDYLEPKIRILFWLMLHKRYSLCYWLLLAENKIKKKNRW